MMRASARPLLFAISAVLVVAIFVIYFQVRDFQFLHYDDNRYVSENPAVAGGLSGSGIRWAFTTAHAANWHPITWMSHMVDVELFGLDAGMHHLVNVVLHAVNAVLLLFLLFRMTGSTWRSGFVAALFALHPLHVESVAWISERKDVLCTLFSLLSLRAYVGYASGGGAGPYVKSLAFFALALLSKPMAVTLPFLLILIDFWPLGRLGTGPRAVGKTAGEIVPVRNLIAEKSPFILLSILSCIVTFAAQLGDDSVTSFHMMPMGVRLSNALMAYALYLGKTVWPASLSAFYPHPWEANSGVIPVWKIAVAGIAVLGMSILSLCRLRANPYLAFGWSWYLGMLVPVIGIVAVGRQGMADRYTYMPLIGIFIAVVWGIPEALEGRRSGRRILMAAGCIVLLALAAVSRNQASYWRDDITLFSHAAEIDPGNAFAHNAIGWALERQGRYHEAIVEFGRALAGPYSSTTPDALLGLGIAYTDLGMFDRATECFRRGLAIGWKPSRFRIALSETFFRQGRVDDAIREMREAVRLTPGNRDALRRLQELESHRARESRVL